MDNDLVNMNIKVICAIVRREQKRLKYIETVDSKDATFMQVAKRMLDIATYNRLKEYMYKKKK